MTKAITTSDQIINNILSIRGQKVLLDADLAKMYGVETRSLVQAVKRNQERFPSDFMFQLSNQEFKSLRSQNVISKTEGRGGRRTPPYAFTEQGVAMLSGVLNSEQAVNVNIAIMRAFIHLRHLIVSNEELAQHIRELEKEMDDAFESRDNALNEHMDMIWDAIEKLIKRDKLKYPGLQTYTIVDDDK